MRLHEWFWCGLAVLMVARLPRCKGCRVFLVLNILQLLEIPVILIWKGWEPRHSLDCIAVLVGILSLCFCKPYPVARAIIAIYSVLWFADRGGLDCPFTWVTTLLTWTCYWLNNLLILVLLGYTLPLANLRYKGNRCLRTLTLIRWYPL